MNGSAIAALLPVIALIGTGFGLARVGLVRQAAVKDMSNLVFLLLLPSLLFRTMATAHLERLDLRSVALYYVVFITLSRWWSTELVAVGVHDWLIEVINMLVNFVTEFLFQKFVVYRGTIDTNELAKKEQA